MTAISCDVQSSGSSSRNTRGMRTASLCNGDPALGGCVVENGGQCRRAVTPVSGASSSSSSRRHQAKSTAAVSRSRAPRRALRVCLFPSFGARSLAMSKDLFNGLSSGSFASPSFSRPCTCSSSAAGSGGTCASACGVRRLRCRRSSGKAGHRCNWRTKRRRARRSAMPAGAL
ncbi:MAG: hypothetical protein QOD39_1763 [Mycobacterium sp.]|nr:hypothetical protein [Mycobacterium sp.]